MQAKKKASVPQPWDACATLGENRAECAALFLEVTTGPSPETEGYCEQGQSIYQATKN